MTSDPTIALYLRAHPRLRETAEAVLERAAAVRAARAVALPPGGPRDPAPGPCFLPAERELFAAVESLEELARGPAPRSSEASAAVHRVMTAAMEMRAENHTQSPRRTTTSSTARTDLFRAISAFAKAFAELEERRRKCHAPPIPWQIELATHIAPGTPVRRMELWGYELPRVPAARKPWGERCFLSGTPWNVDSHTAPARRYRSLEARGHTMAPKYHALFARLRTALDSLAGTAAEAVEAIARLLPALYEDYIAVSSSPTFERLGLLDYPSLAVTLNNLFRAHAERPLLGTRGGDGHYSWVTYDDVRVLALRLAYAFERLGCVRGERIAIVVAPGSHDFYLADFAAIFAGLVSVGLPDTATDDRIVAMLDSTRPRLAAADASSLARLSALAERCAEPPPVVEIADLLAGEAVPASWSSDSGIALATGLIYGDRDGYRTAAAEGIRADGEDDLYTLLFTSGSTGTPKATMVTRRRWAEEMCFEAGIWPYVGVSFQPAAVAADRGSVWRALTNGGRVGFVRRGAAFFEDVRAVRPTLLDAPPVIWNILYAEYKKAIADPGLTRCEAARVRLRFRNSLGGRLVFMAIGGAASDPGVRRVLEELFGVAMKDGYGTTETGNIAADGRLLPGLDYRLIDLPELGYTAADQPRPRGELAVRTPRTTARYWNDDNTTSSAFTDDGYFRTGDIVELGPGRQLRILGRSRRFFKLAGSEFVSPDELERHYLTSERLEAILVTGSPLRRSVVAVAVTAHDGVSEAEVLADMRAIARREGLRPAEVPAGVALVPRVDGKMPWTSENGLLTASLKPDRRALEARYCAEIEAAYERAEARRESSDSPKSHASREDGIRQAAAALLGIEPGEIDPERSFQEHGGDSVAAMELALRLEQIFSGKADAAGSVSPPCSPRGDSAPPEPRQLAVAPLREVARELLGEPAPSPPSAADEAAAANDDAVDVPRPDPLPPPATTCHVFLTGATGFLGVHLLAHLAASLPAGGRVYALVRAADGGAARERLVRALCRAGLDVPEIGLAGDRQETRVITLAGSLTDERFGLEPKVHERLAVEVGVIYHVAAEVSFGKSYSELRAANVLGTRQVLEFATRTTLKALHFVSSLNVALLLQQIGGRRAREDSPLPPRLAPEIVAAQPGYAVSKWVGERMIGELFSHGRGAFRASVSRPALIAWSTLTGAVNDDDWLARVLASCLAMRQAIGDEEAGVLQWAPETPASARGLDLVPVDFAARAVGRIGELTAAGALSPRGETLSFPSGTSRHPVPTFHVSNTAPAQEGHVAMRRLMDLLIIALLRRGAPDSLTPQIVPMSEWMLRSEIEATMAVPILPLLRRISPLLERATANRFIEVMAELCPAVDLAWVEKLVGRPSIRH